MPKRKTPSSVGTVTTRTTAKGISLSDLPVHVLVGNPTAYLRSLMAVHVADERFTCPIVPPTRERLQNYTMDAVTAVRNNQLDQLREILATGKSLDACNRNGESLLHLACRRADLETVEFLLDEGKVPYSLADGMGRTALFDACWRPRPDVEILDALVQRVSPVLLLGEDTWGHCCFDYVRKGDHHIWMQFLDDRKDMLLSSDRRKKLKKIVAPVGVVG